MLDGAVVIALADDELALLGVPSRTAGRAWFRSIALGGVKPAAADVSDASFFFFDIR